MAEPAHGPTQEHTNGEVRLSRDMTMFQVLMIGIGAMIGAGIFVLTGTAAGEAGPAVILAFALNGCIAFMTAFVYAEMGSMMPAAGGGYVWAQHGVGGLPAFIAGWVSWFGHSVACSLYAIGFGHYLGAVLGAETGHVWFLPAEVFAKAAAVIAILTFGYVNFRGSSETGRIGVLITLGKLVILGLFILSGLWVLRGRPDWSAGFAPFFPEGFGGVFAAMGIIYIAFQGYEIVAQCGEEVVNPGRNIPRAILWSVAIVLVVYLLIAFVSIGAVIAPDGTPSWLYLGQLKELGIVEAARQFMFGGPAVGGFLLLLGGLVSTISALNATIYSSSRVSYAMARDANLPPVFAEVHRARRTPHNAIMVSLAIIVVMAVAFPLEDVASAADIMFLLLFLMVNATAMVLRRRRPDLERPFLAPWFPVLPILAILLQFALAAHLFTVSRTAWYVSAGWLAAGVYVFLAYARTRQRTRALTPVAARRAIVEHREHEVMVAVGRPENLANLVGLARALALPSEGQVAILNVVNVPSHSPLSAGEPYVPEAQAFVHRAAEICDEAGVASHSVVRIAHHPHRAILDTVTEERPDLLVLGWRGWTPNTRRALGATLDPVVRKAPCDVAMFRAAQPIETLRRVIVAVTGSPQAGLTVRCGKAIAASLGIPLRLLRLVPASDPDQDWAPLEAEALSERFGHRVVLRNCRTVLSGILEEVRDDDLLVIGASWDSLVGQRLRGSFHQTVADAVSCSVLLLRKYPGRVRTGLKELLIPMDESDFAEPTAPSERPISV